MENNHSLMLINKNLILTAENFNVSIFRESWFLENEIFNKEDIDSSKTFFTPSMIQVEGGGIRIVINPLQMILSLTKEEEGFEKFNLLYLITKNLPHIPYQASGMNFDFLIEDLGGKKSNVSILNDHSPIHNEFINNSENPRFGIYASKDYLNSRLKLDIKPVMASINNQEESKEYLHLKFNFNLLGSFNQNNFKAFIKNAGLFLEYAESLVTKYENQ